MKFILTAFSILALAACGTSQPLTPTADAVSSPVSVAAAVTSAPLADKGPNHFDPAPLSGWDSAKWHDLTVQSPKYVFGRALVGLDPTEDNLKRVAESQGLTYLGSDVVRFADGTVVDCIFGAHTSKAHWQYQVSH